MSGSEVPERNNTPDVHKLPWDHDRLAEWVDPPPYRLEDAEQCSTCRGTGTVSECPECDGDGEIEFDTEFHTYYVTCKSCDGDGVFAGPGRPCPVCKGAGRKLFTPVKWQRGFISMKHLDRIKVLPGLKLSLHGDPLEIIRFRFDGGVGLLMPMAC